MTPAERKVYEAMSHAQIYSERGKIADPMLQAQLGPLEHRAFAREFAQESPIQAAISLPFAIPAYTAAKALGLQKSRTPASMDEITEAYAGLLEGLRK